jgi:hypothetical protein
MPIKPHLKQNLNTIEQQNLQTLEDMPSRKRHISLYIPAVHTKIACGIQIIHNTTAIHLISEQ